MPIVPASKICGAAVANPAGETLGAITDVMIDSETGAIAYAVLAHGGVLGVGEKLFAVPWQAFTPGDADGSFELDAQPAVLARGTGIDKDAWPTRADRDWSA